MKTFKILTFIVGIILILMTVIVGIINNGWEDVLPVFIIFVVMAEFDHLISSWKNNKD